MYIDNYAFCTSHIADESNFIFEYQFFYASSYLILFFICHFSIYSGLELIEW